MIFFFKFSCFSLTYIWTPTMQTVSILYHPLPLTLGQILESPREPLRIHAQAALHWNLLNHNLRGGSQALVTLQLPQVIPLGNKGSHCLTETGTEEHLMVMTNDMGPQEMCTPTAVSLEGLRKKAAMSFQLLGGHLLKPEGSTQLTGGQPLCSQQHIAWQWGAQTCKWNKRTYCLFRRKFGTLTKSI